MAEDNIANPAQLFTIYEKGYKKYLYNGDEKVDGKLSARSST